MFIFSFYDKINLGGFRMIRCIEQLSKDIIFEVSELYFKNKLSVNKIMQIENMSKNEVLSILNSTHPYFKFSRSDLSCFSFSHPSFLVISDTHIGNENMNEQYIEEVYRLAKEKKISHIFHTGDVIQSTMSGVSKKMQKEEKQLELLVQEYPRVKGIQTHFLLGNHDFKTLSKNSYFMSILQSRKDFDILGFKRCYISWYKNLLSLNHEIANYHFHLPYVSDTLMNFYGHRHDLLIKNNCIYLPTLSNDLKHYGKKEVSPGFIEVNEEDGKGCVQHYRVFDHKGIHSVNQGTILKRKLR